MEGPRAFSREELAAQDCLFAHRAALFYTPTEYIPAEYVGKGIFGLPLSRGPRWLERT